MLQRWRTGGRSKVRFSIGLLLAPIALLSVLLFFTGEGPLPAKALVSWEELGCQPSWTQDYRKDHAPRFMCFSACGEYYAVLIPHLESPDQSRGDLVIHELSSKQTVSVIKSVERYISIVRISPDKKLLDIETPGGTQSISLYCLPSGEPIERILMPDWQNNTYQSYRGEFDSTGNLFLITGTNLADILDTRNWSRKRLIDFPDGQELPIQAGFFDHQNRPRILVQSGGNAEVWDLAKRRRDWRAKNVSPISGTKAVGWVEPSELVCSASMKFITSQVDQQFQVRSLEDGTTLATHKRPDASTPQQYSRDGRFVLCSSTRASWQAQLIERLPTRSLLWIYESGWGEWVDASRKAICEFALIDLESGKSWAGLPAVWREPFDAAFRERDQKLITATDEGFYEWDLPPRWQRFTPWAWASLAVWLLLAVTWRVSASGQPIIR
jgi:hypothetical protein